MNASERIILGLDVNSLSEVKHIVELCSQCCWFKVGSQLFTREGPAIVDWLKEKGKRVFLDLKFHDIPNTVMNAVGSAISLGVDMLTIHSLGGSKMIRSAREKVEGTNTKIIAVTILTSHREENIRNELGIGWTLKEAVYKLAQMALSSGAHGVVCSPEETKELRDRMGNEFIIITPGVRPVWSADTQDQARVMTPKDAISVGATYIVVSRPVLKAEDPKIAFEKILMEIENV